MQASDRLVDDARMGRVDLETVEAIDRLGDRMDELHTSLDDRIDTFHRSLGDRIDAFHTSLDQRIDAVGSALGNRIDTLGDRIDTVETTLGTRIDGLGREVADLRVDLATLRAELHQGLEEGRRHALVLNESSRHDIQMVAEGVAALAVKIDSRHR